MSERRLCTPLLLGLALPCLVAQAQDERPTSGVRAALAAIGERVARDDPQVLRLRRRSGLPTQLLQVAQDPSAAEAIRRSALRLLGEVGVSPAGLETLGQAKGGLAAAAARARARIAIRVGLHRRLDGLAPGARPVDVVGAFTAVELRELAEMARDPLLPARRKATVQRLQLSLARRVFRHGAISADCKARLARWLGQQRIKAAANAIKRLARSPALKGRDRCRVVVALLQLEPGQSAKHLPRLVRYALDADDQLSDTATLGLADLRPPGLSAHLLRVFNAPDPGGSRRVRAIQLIEVLGLGGTSVVERLSVLLKDPAQLGSVRQAAAHALGGLGSEAGLRALVAILQDPAPELAALRREAADGLASSARLRGQRPPVARQALEDALLRKGAEPTVRRAALRALAAYASPLSRKALRAFLSRPRSSSTRARLELLRACTALELFTAADARTLLRLGVSADASLALAVVGYARRLEQKLAVPALLGLLEHRAPDVSRAAEADLRRRWPASERRPLDPGERPTRATVEVWRTRWKRQAERFQKPPTK